MSGVCNGKEIGGLPEAEMNALRWREISVIFQGALNALNPVRSVGHQIAEPIRVHEPSVSAAEAKDRARELLEAVGIPAARAASYPHHFSGGMRQRVMIAMALACRPKLVIADEPITALDVMTQAQILDLMRDLCDRFSLSMLLISHDLSVLSQTCDRVVFRCGCVIPPCGWVVSRCGRIILPCSEMTCFDRKLTGKALKQPEMR